MKKRFKNIVIVTVANIIAIILAILILSVLHLTIGMTIAKIDGNDVQLIEAVIFCLKVNTKFVITGLVVVSVIYSGHKLLKSELNAVNKD